MKSIQKQNINSFVKQSAGRGGLYASASGVLSVGNNTPAKADLHRIVHIYVVSYIQIFMFWKLMK